MSYDDSKLSLTTKAVHKSLPRAQRDRKSILYFAYDSFTIKICSLTHIQSDSSAYDWKSRYYSFTTVNTPGIESLNPFQYSNKMTPSFSLFSKELDCFKCISEPYLDLENISIMYTILFLLIFSHVQIDS